MAQIGALVGLSRARVETPHLPRVGPSPHREAPDAAVATLPTPPARKDVRLLVAGRRDGQARCLLRQRDHDRDDRVALGEDIAPGLVSGLLSTFA